MEAWPKRMIQEKPVRNDTAAPKHSSGGGVLAEYDRNISCLHNALATSNRKSFTPDENSDLHMEDSLRLGKRLAADSVSGSKSGTGDKDNEQSKPVDLTTATVPVGNTTVIAGQFESSTGGIPGDGGTPQKNANRKKLKGQDGVAVELTPTVGSAASMREDRRTQ